MKSRYLWLLSPLAACSSDPPGPGQIPQIETAPLLDVYQPPPQDFGPWPDQTPLPDLNAADQQAADQGQPPSCEEPQDVTCTACPDEQLCVSTAGGTRCTPALVLAGPVDKLVFAAIAEAYVECWQKDPSDDTLCATVDSCELEGLVTEQMVKNWVCNDAQVLDFSSGAVHDEARSLCACGTLQLIDRPEWKLGIEPGSRRKVCFWYDVKTSLLPDRITVDYCQNFLL